MSLEQIIKDNTAALVALTGALNAKANRPADNTPPVEFKGPLTPPAPQPQTPAGQPAVAIPSYAVVAEAVTTFVKAHGRAPAVELLKPWNTTTITGFKEKPVELAAIYAAFTDPVKGAAAIAAAAAAPKA